MNTPPTTTSTEFNFDGLIGPTHNYAGLAQGNLASQQNKNLTSHPKAAALQGLDKGKFLADLGIPQAVLPPHERPHIPALRSRGFAGTDAEILEKAARTAPQLLAACSSSSFMWAANAATVSPSPDTRDHLLHLTPANLQSHFHRSIETPFTASLLKRLLPGPLVAHHPALPPEYPDEGAANHSRLCQTHAAPAIEVFVYGRTTRPEDNPPTKTPPRQTLEASFSIARLHQLDPDRTVFLRQSPQALDAGVFHNDVIALAHQHVFLYHTEAYADLRIKELRESFATLCPGPKSLLPVGITPDILPLQDAVRSYLFNSQLVTLPDSDGAFLLLAPIECSDISSARRAIDDILQRAPIISRVCFIDVRQSMQNGGGPACLRLRIVLTPQQQAAMHPHILLTPTLYQQLRAWIEKNYRETLTPKDLADPHLLKESRTALDQLTRILHLPNLYNFQN